MLVYVCMHINPPGGKGATLNIIIGVCIPVKSFIILYMQVFGYIDEQLLFLA